MLAACRYAVSAVIAALLCLEALTTSAATPAEPLVTNGDFEAGASLRENGWTWWSRTDHGSAAYSGQSRCGSRSARLTHDGPRDWAFHNSARIDATPG